MHNIVIVVVGFLRYIFKFKTIYSWPTEGQNLKFRFFGVGIYCKKIIGKQTKMTNHILEDKLQENYQKADKNNRPVKGPDGATGLLAGN